MRIVVSNPDHIGDFVLRQPMLAGLHDAGHDVFLVTRDFVAPLAAMTAPFARLFTCPGNPYAPEFQLATPLGRELIGRVRDFQPDVLVVAPYQHTRLEEQLAAALPSTDCVGFNGFLFQPARNVVEASTLRLASQATVSREMPEVRKNETLCGAVLGSPTRLPYPSLTPDAASLESARERLRRAGLEGQKFWAVCAAEVPWKEVRNWRPDQWSALLRGLLDRQGVPLAFIGTPDEHESSEAIRRALGVAAKWTVAFTEDAMDLSTTIGVLSLSEGYLGRDTGPMHLAAALGKPVVSVMGGGDWPRFVPAARIGRTFTVRVPCTGCQWMCHLQVSHCVKDIPVDAVLPAAEAMIEHQLDDFQVVVLQPDPLLESSIIRESWQKSRQQQINLEKERADFMQWHSDRVRDIEGLRKELAALEADRVALRERVHALETDLASSNSARQERERATHQEADEWRSRIAGLEAICLQLLADRNEMRESHTREREVAAAERERTLAERDRAAAAQQQQWQAEKNAYIAQCAQLEESRARLAAERDTAVQEQEQLQLERLQLQTLAEQLTVRLQELESQSTATENADWLEERHSLMQKIEEQWVQIGVLQAQLDGSASQHLGKISDLEQLLRRRSDELRTALAVIPDLRSELVQQQTESERQQALLQEKRRSVAALEQERNEYLGSWSAALNDLEQANQTIQHISADQKAKQQLIERLSSSLADVEREAKERLRLIEVLSERLTVVEEDRGERLQVIEVLSERLTELEEDRAERLQVIEVLSERLTELEEDRAERLRVIEVLSERLTELEEDRAERLRVIEVLSERLTELDEDRAERLRVIERLSEQLQQVEQDRALRLRSMEILHSQLEKAQGELKRQAEECARRESLIGESDQRIAVIEEDRAERLRLITALATQLQESQAESERRVELLRRVTKEHREAIERLELIENDREDRGRQIFRLHEEIEILRSRLATIDNQFTYRILKRFRLA
jgi:ADP-heptose:LPS heptosyltransferase